MRSLLWVGCTRLGRGVIQDYNEAAKWYRKSAEQGWESAQFNLGLMYYNGHGVIQDYNQALKWWRKAVEQGHVNAQVMLGKMYYDGRGVSQDDVYAHMWSNIAASTGDAEAIKNRDIVAEYMTPAQIAEAQKLARECVRKNYKGC